MWRVTAVADPTVERLNLIGDRFERAARRPVYGDYRELLRSGLVDAVDIAVPHRYPRARLPGRRPHQDAIPQRESRWPPR